MKPLNPLSNGWKALESALKAFEEGQKAVAQCRTMLEEAELKLKDLRDAEKTENE